MAVAPRFFRLDENELVAQAKENLKHTRGEDDNALMRQALIDEVDRLMPFDAARERLKKAERIVKDRERPHKTPPEGTLWFSEVGSWPYEPQQLIPDGEGKTVERDLATPHFISVSLDRSTEDLEKKQRAHRRRVTEHDHFSEWAADQALADRPPNEITFGNFVREKGHWRADELPLDEDTEEVVTP